MPRHHQPIEVAEMKGAVKANPRRYKNRPSKNPLPFGDPPEHLPEGVKKVWFELEGYSLPGVLTSAERPMMEVLATLLCQFRASPLDFPTPRAALIITCLARLGMSPGDRQKIVLPKGDTKPPAWAEFVQ